MKINICILGLGYVGLPLILNLSKRFNCVGFDIDQKRIKNLKANKDTNKEFSSYNFKNKKIKFTFEISEVKNCNFFIVCVPTPITKNKKPQSRFSTN